MKKFLTIIMILAVVLALAFIFGNSLLSKKQSSSFSSAVYELVQPILDDLPIEEAFGLEGHAFLRKAAHFAEFFLLAIILNIAIANALPIGKKGWASYISFILCVIVAFMDEGLQILSDRGNSLSDVLIDVLGGAFGIACAIAVRLIGYLICKIKNTSKMG